ncbi:EGF domain-specific O-linked N-acetylglucosamine transferase isoform X2 [Parasteatoda tepidariorum]|uniref:EGF domain-specific O-linked N-acetylglucosamine transferase isoform X2 n=1 Tax=Parasteatoda tepidariorum TaxID=114398 RepID=UPI0039BD18F2
MLRFKMFFLCLMSIIITCLITLVISNSHILELNLPPEHIPYYFSNHPIESQNCANSDSCSHKGSLGLNKCWGYEKGCSESDRFSTPDCNQSSKGWYRDDVIREGQVGGHCKLKKKLLKQQGQHKSPLQSWYAEFEHFTELPELPKDQNLCDIIINQPTFIMKLDAAVNMYHHFCDFLNLYATLHMNQTFSTDVQILIWDTIPYMSNFAPVWKAFTQHPLMNLGSLKGKRVCFKDVVFPLLPRMIFGMYYNMPLIPGCQGSGLFRAFAQHIKHRLQIPDLFFDSKIRVTLISRSTQYRRILNEDELISSLKVYPELLVKKVNFNRQMSFTEQLKISYNTDILIGIHGAGLTHMLFMPEWGSVFEIFNCEDESCYADLARLKGLKYLTWEKLDKLYPEDEGHHPTLGAHAKFTNYSFDVKEFLRIFKKLMNHVKQHPAFQQKRNICHGTTCNKTFIHNEL